MRVVACLAEGLGIRATARGFEVAPNTVLHWLGEAAEQLRAFSTFPRIPTKMPFRAVFMRGRCRHACMDDLVVDGAPHKVQAAYPLISR